MEVGLIRKVDIDREMQQAYLDYAMSVIVARALPDARDGLKPVQRRILYAMHDMGLLSDTPYRKSARIVGEVLGKYHPHGDMPVYEAMARMAQDFAMRYPLVDGQGNFGSVDGDAPAAMRYTEARLARTATHLLADLEKDTVEFSSNFDASLEEPDVLPAAMPNLLVNGATGIAVGMATSIPPHNLGEIVDALVFMLERWTKLDDVSADDLMRLVQGPDFPTGGLLLRNPSDEDGLSAAYGTGRGKVTVRAKVHVEDAGRGRSRLIITELPYQTNKAALIERMAELVRDGTLEGITDLRDESDRQGMRVVIELAKTADADRLLHELYRRTPLQDTFSINLLALVKGEPRLLSLKQALRVYLEHRQEVVRRRSEFELARARDRAHVLEGLRVALKNLDEVIRLIRNSREPDEAKQRLIKHYRLSEVQSIAILDMPLRRLATLERQKIENEYKEKLQLIRTLEGLLASPKRIREVIATELRAIQAAFGDRRRTQIVTAPPGRGRAAALTATELVPSREVWVTLDRKGRVSRCVSKAPPTGSTAPLAILAANTRDWLYLFTAKGRAACVPVLTLPERDSPDDGAPFASLSALDANASVVAAVAVRADLTPIPGRSAATPSPFPSGDGGRGRGKGVRSGFLFLATHNGMVKRIALGDLPGPSSQAVGVMAVAEADRLGWLRLTTGSDEVMLVTSLGQCIRFKESEVRPMGFGAAGVLGIKIGRRGDVVVGLDVVRPRAEMVLVAEDGRAKRMPLAQFPVQGRYGVGVAAWKLVGKARLAGMAVGQPDDRLAVVTSKATFKFAKIEAAPKRGRSSRGAVALKLKAGETVAGLVPVLPSLVVAVPARKPRPKAVKRAKRSRG